jgi:energy-coupling factor transporter ATP-binding protein EcfA2
MGGDAMLIDDLRALAGELSRRASDAPSAELRADAERVRRHVDEYVIPRAADADAPLVVVVLGSTGSGKSSLLNALTGAAVSPSGVLRPTTRRPTAVAHPDDAAAFNLLPGLADRQTVDVVLRADARRGLVLVDAPDFDSIELANRDLAVELLELADLVIFVSTATRYADQVPWQVLERARQRGVPMLMVLNRLPPESDDSASVIADYRRLIEHGQLADSGAFGAIEIVAVTEGSRDPARDALDAAAVAPVRAALDRLVQNDVERRDLARRSLASAVTALPAAVEEIAREMEDEEASARALLSVAERAYAEHRTALGREIGRGTFLRAEVLRQWQAFVGAGQVARMLSSGLGRVTATVRSLFQPGPPPPTADVREAAFADLVALTVQHADSAARRTASSWIDDRHGQRAMAVDPGLWGASAGLGDRLTAELEAWATALGERIRELGQQRKGWAQAASLGVNAIGTSAVLAVFVHTGGLTGAEVGITAATAVVNQKLLEAVFGEANVAAFVSGGRDALRAILDDAFAAERDRYRAALGVSVEGGASRIRELALSAAAASSGT